MGDSDSDEEITIRYGTPLDPLEEDEIPSKKKYQPPEQYAVDEHGRRRFHGAFTGGFSAGFFNSVGTPEGWTPSTFKSSRSDKAQFSNQRPEDFMDEEDRSEFGIAPRNIQANQEFSGQKRTRVQYHDGTIPGAPVLEQLLRPVHETTAVKILRKMGWREGQGIGDRVSKSEKKRNKEQHRVYGCYMPAEMRQEATQESESSDSEFEYDQLFAPDDYEPYILKNKNDRFGLGYEGLSRHSVLGNLTGEYNSLSSKSHLLMKDKGKKVSIRGQAFGVGAFEADDEDIYAREDMSHYDFEMGPEMKTVKKVNQRQSNVLQGFVKSKAPPPSIPRYAPPSLPRDFVPAVRRSRFDDCEARPRDQGLGRHELTAEARGALLGETPLPKTQEINDINTQTTKQAPIIVLGKNINFVSEVKELDFISIKETNNTNVKVFKPFASDPHKQLRYEKYLENTLQVDNSTDRLSEWERSREMAEFEQAAKLYKPLSGIMGDRFTHASEPDEALNPLCAVAKSSINYGLATPEQIEAAKLGGYGVMTRKETIWRPESLVCKRFNVPEIGGARPEQSKEDKPKVSYSIFSYMESSVHDKESFTKEQTKFSGSKSLNIEPKGKEVTQSNNIDKEPNKETVTFNKRLTVAELFLKESEKDLQEKNNEVAETIEKFDKIDLYKSIFLSDSENEEDIRNDFAETPKNVERNTSPPRGIFANIDFDELNAWKRNTDKPIDKKDIDKKDTKDNNKNIEEKSASTENDKSSDASELMYGPKIPDNLHRRLEISDKDTIKPVFRRKDERDESSSSSDSWVEAKNKPKKQKKKKSKKQKSKHKKKHKKKDR